MPDTPYLIAVVAVLAAIATAVWAAWHTRVRPAGPPDTAAEPAPPTPAPAESADTRCELAAARSEISRLTDRLRQAQTQLATAGTPAAHTDGRHVEIFVNLSRRLQSLVHREIKLLDALENEVEDPDLLKGLFQVDHLATRIRRHAENLAVLGGSVSRRQWSRPVALTEVLRSAIAEVEHYSRVKLVPPIEGRLPGHAVASVIHLIAELIENATMFAPPQTQVLLRAQQVTAGVAIEVEDRGLGMQRSDMDRVNQLLINPEDTNLDDLLRDGRIGLYVVSVIARQHGIVVQLQTNIYGGTQAVIILPQQLIASSPEPALDPAPPRNPAPDRPAPDGRRPDLPRPAAQQPDQPRPDLQRPDLQRRLPLQKRLPALDRLQSLTQDTTEFARQPARPAATPARPPLPRRHSQTHMAPQLQLGPPRQATEPPAEHNPGLMASFMSGISQGQEDPPGSTVRTDVPPRP